MREQLIRYLMGELDDDERRQVRALLRENPALQQELQHLRDCLAANQDGDEELEPKPSRNLASRTAQFISDSDEFEIEQATKRAGTMTSDGDPPAGVLGWSLADLAVAFGVMMAVSMLVFPAIRDSREGTRRTACANNLRQFGQLVQIRAVNRGGFVPPVLPGETAGVFAARLIEEEVVTPEELAPLLVCPAAPMANEVRAKRLIIHIPSALVFQKMSPEQLAHVTAQISPFYAYRFPYRVNGSGNLHYLRDDRSPFSPIMCDTADDASNSMSPNHGGSILQVLCQDGHVRVLNTYIMPEMSDDLFHNNMGKVSVGLGPSDAVLAPSDTMVPRDESDVPSGD